MILTICNYGLAIFRVFLQPHVISARVTVCNT